MPTEDAEIVEDMIHESSAGWEDYDVDSATLLRFLATSGNQACYGQRYQVEETATSSSLKIRSWRPSRASPAGSAGSEAGGEEVAPFGVALTHKAGRLSAEGGDG